MSPNGRGTCSVCGKSVAVRYDGGALAHHAVGDLYDGDYCKGRGKPVRQPGVRTEEEAANALAKLLNEIQAAGHEVQILPDFGSGYHLSIGEASLFEPTSHLGPWEVTL